MTNRPNILFFCSDQHQTAASGCYGHAEAQTPNIDRIAASGIRSNRAYCQSPVCVPARGSIITAQYPHTHGARILQDALSPNARTIAHHFAEHGYQTGAIGKMHFVDETQKHGFDYRLPAIDIQLLPLIAELRVGGVILSLASLSFLGYGLPPGIPDWGGGCSAGKGVSTWSWRHGWPSGLASASLSPSTVSICSATR